MSGHSGISRDHLVETQTTMVISIYSSDSQVEEHRQKIRSCLSVRKSLCTQVTHFSGYPTLSCLPCISTARLSLKSSQKQYLKQMPHIFKERKDGGTITIKQIKQQESINREQNYAEMKYEE